MKRKYPVMLILSVLLATAAILTAGCAEESEAPTQTIEDVTTEEAFNLIQENKSNPNFIIVDVRTPQEFAEGHIENAINIDFRSDAFKDEIGNLDRTRKYLLYCRSGNRSRGALSVMTELGFKEVYHLSAGIIGWAKAEYPVTK